MDLNRLFINNKYLFKRNLSTKYSFTLCVTFLFVCCYLFVIRDHRNSLIDNSVTSSSSFQSSSINSDGDEFKTILGLSLCWSQRAKVYDKGNFPYNLAASLSTKLWLNKTDVFVDLSILYAESNPPSKLLDFKKELEELNSHYKTNRVNVKLFPSGDMDCVLKSQIQRMFAYKNSPIYKPGDIVVTSDVDTFVMDKDIFKEFKSKDFDRLNRIWLFQYADTIKHGFTFNMNFIGMSIKLWRSFMEDVDIKTPEDLISKYKEPMGLDTLSPWDYDQLIISRIILESGLCSLPENSPLWKTLKLEDKITKKYFNDFSTCYHGSGFEDCNHQNPTQTPTRFPCKRWHFYPYERANELKEKFNEIMKGKALRAPSMPKKFISDLKYEFRKMFHY